MGLPLSWLSHLPNKEAKAEFETVLRNSTLVLTRLREIIQTELRSIELWERNPQNYDTPSWSHKQAHFNGQRSSYEQLLRLTDFINDR